MQRRRSAPHTLKIELQPRRPAWKHRPPSSNLAHRRRAAQEDQPARDRFPYQRVADLARTTTAKISIEEVRLQSQLPDS